MDDKSSRVGDFYRNSSQKIPLVKEFEVLVETNLEKRLQMFLDGKVDWMDVSNAAYGRVVKDERVVELVDGNEIIFTNFPNLAMRWLGFNMRDPLLGSESGINIRKAIAHAIDREKYNEVLSNGTNMEANSIINPGIWGYNPSAKPPFDFDVRKQSLFLKIIRSQLKLNILLVRILHLELQRQNF